MTRKRHFLVALATTFCCLLGASGAFASPAQTPAESGFLAAVNATRAAHGLNPLSLDATLSRAARAHSAGMMHAGQFAHGNFSGRMLAFHVHGPLVGENLAWGSGSYATPSTVMAEWLASPEHRANLLRPTFTRIGIGAARGSFMGNGGATVVTADFAGR